MIQRKLPHQKQKRCAGLQSVCMCECSLACMAKQQQSGAKAVCFNICSRPAPLFSFLTFSYYQQCSQEGSGSPLSFHPLLVMLATNCPCFDCCGSVFVIDCRYSVFSSIDVKTVRFDATRVPVFCCLLHLTQSGLSADHSAVMAQVQSDIIWISFGIYC